MSSKTKRILEEARGLEEEPHLVSRILELLQIVTKMADSRRTLPSKLLRS